MDSGIQLLNNWGQVEYQGMRDGKGVHTIRDSCYHKEKGAERMWGGGRWQQTRQW